MRLCSPISYPDRRLYGTHGSLRVFSFYNLSSLSLCIGVYFLLRFHNSFLTCVVIRLSVKYAKHQFLTTYFDPFYADLHLHRDKPHANYDPKIFTFFNNTPSADSPHFALRLFRKASSAIWNGLTGTVARWQRSAWDAWGAPSNPMQTKRVAWPPS